VADIADDGDRESLETLLALVHGESIQQPLGRVRHVRFAADSTLTWGATFAATNPSTPASASRITNASTCRACRV